MADDTQKEEKEQKEDGGKTESYGILTRQETIPQQFPARFLRGADILLFAVVPVGTFAALPIWGGNPPIHDMFTVTLVANVVAFQFGLLPTLYPASWYAEESSSTSHTHSNVSPPVKSDQIRGGINNEQRED